MLFWYWSLRGEFIQGDIQLLVLAAHRQSGQRLGYQLDHQERLEDLRRHVGHLLSPSQQVRLLHVLQFNE
ncbi:hypothetical protein EYF80_012095 [Liparis tanakae]|uniref:Uncharacterized protein n=1 Tax=Liparis tanakae TaxID=230148 RepID=A0A4Z2IJ28_9TELE|nr:hypothetical protein EYF80_012095 [Liparis tanakae]